MRINIARWGARLTTSVVLCLTLLLVCFGVASARALHAKVVDSNPKMGATIAQPPAMVTVTTAENMKPGASNSNLFVYGPNGELISQGDAKVALHNPRQMSVALKANQQGVYVVQWKTVSVDDGDPDQGAFTFTVGKAVTSAQMQSAAPANAAPASPATTGTNLLPAIITGVVALLVGLGAGFGFGRLPKTEGIQTPDGTDTHDVHTHV
jgi:Uncharacterized protein, homolog of Cu resistance protein CopC